MIEVTKHQTGHVTSVIARTTCEFAKVPDMLMHLRRACWTGLDHAIATDLSYIIKRSELIKPTPFDYYEVIVTMTLEQGLDTLLGGPSDESTA